MNSADRSRPKLFVEPKVIKCKQHEPAVEVFFLLLRVIHSFMSAARLFVRAFSPIKTRRAVIFPALQARDRCGMSNDTSVRITAEDLRDGAHTSGLHVRPGSACAATQTWPHSYYYNTNDQQYKDTSCNSFKSNSAVYYINPVARTPSLDEVRLSGSVHEEPLAIVAEPEEEEEESVTKVLLRLFHVFGYILRWVAAIFQFVLIILLFSNGRGWFNVISFLSLIAFGLAHYGLWKKSVGFLYPIFVIDFIASIVYIIFAIIFFADAEYHYNYGFPTYLYRQTFVEQNVVGFCLIMTTIFIIWFLIVLGRVWWGRPFCYPYPYMEHHRKSESYTADMLIDQICGCFH